MADFKYIMFQDERTGRLAPVIFPNEFVHDEMAEAVIISGVGRPAFMRPISAGFLDLAVVSTRGHSETLNMQSRPEDARIINTHPYTSGIESGLEPRIEAMLLVKHIEGLLEKVK